MFRCFVGNIFSTIKSECKRLSMFALIMIVVNIIPLVVPVFINSALGNYFANMSMQVDGSGDYFLAKLYETERIGVVSLIIGLLVACLVVVLISFAIYNIMKEETKLGYKYGRKMSSSCANLAGVSGVVVLFSNVISLLLSWVVASILGAALGIEISISMTTFLVLLLSEVLLSFFVQYLCCVYLYNE